MNLARSNIFFILLILFGFANVNFLVSANLLDGFIGYLDSDKILRQINQYFILIPFLGLFFHSLTKRDLFYPALGVLIAIWTKNIVIIFTAFIISEIFLIERGREDLKFSRRELIILTLSFVPISLFLDKTFSSIFFCLFIVGGIFGSFSIRGKDRFRKKVEEIILFLPLKMIIIVYYSEKFLSGWGVELSKFILALVLSGVFLYGLAFRFSYGLILGAAQILLLALSLSHFNDKFIESYFIFGMILVLCTENNKLKWFLFEVFLIVLFSALNARPNLLIFLPTSTNQDLYSLIVIIQMVFFLSLLVFRSGYLFKKYKTSQKEKLRPYPAIILGFFVVANAMGINDMGSFANIEWKNKVILGTYFMLLFFLPSVFDFPSRGDEKFRIERKRERIFSLIKRIFLVKGGIYYIFSAFYYLLKVMLRIFGASYFFIQEFVVGIIFLLSDMVERGIYRKYQYLVTLLLLIYLFLCVKILMVAQ